MSTEGEEDQKQIDVAELQAQLAEAVLTRDEALQQLRTQIDVPKQSSPPERKCMFLDRLPLELRNKIYTLLLVSEDLSTYSDFRDLTSFEPTFQYGLSPNIPRASRQIYEEASAILYGSNVFIIYFHHEGGFPRTPVVETWRDEENTYDEGKVAAMLYVPILTKVKHWKALLDIESTDYFEFGKVQEPTRYFSYFCRLLCRNPPRSLEVVVRPHCNISAKYIKADNWTILPGSAFSYNEMNSFLKPLKLLRNIKYLN